MKLRFFISLVMFYVGALGAAAEQPVDFEGFLFYGEAHVSLPIKVAAGTKVFRREFLGLRIERVLCDGVAVKEARAEEPGEGGDWREVAVAGECWLYTIDLSKIVFTRDLEAPLFPYEIVTIEPPSMWSVIEIQYHVKLPDGTQTRSWVARFHRPKPEH